MSIFSAVDVGAAFDAHEVAPFSELYSTWAKVTADCQADVNSNFGGDEPAAPLEWKQVAADEYAATWLGGYDLYNPRIAEVLYIVTEHRMPVK